MIKQKIKKRVFDVTQMARRIYTDYIIDRDDEYINISKVTKDAENAQVALMVRQQFDTLRLHRYPGSIPGWGDSAISFVMGVQT